MIPNFLCSNHHRHYQQSPEEAVLAWDEWMTAGHRATLDKDPELAFRFYGNSMEVAEILMNTSKEYITLSPITPFERLQLAGQHLAELCQRNGHQEISEAIKKKLDATLKSHRHACCSQFADNFQVLSTTDNAAPSRVH